MPTPSPQERDNPTAATAGPSEAEKRAALEQVLATASFERAEQLRVILRYVCEAEIAGRAGELSEYLIGVEALGKVPGYSTGDDAGVRKRVHDLRQRLEDLYAGELSSARVRIELPKGRYAPRFLYGAPAGTTLVPAAPAAVAAASVAAPIEAIPTPGRSRILVKVFWFGVVVGVLAALAGQFLWGRWHPQRQIVADPGKVLEAEGRSNVLEGNALAASCPACSGRGRVKWIGRGGGVVLAADVPEAGQYMLQIDYLVDGPRTLYVGVNDAGAIELALRGNSWWVPASTAVMVRLQAGRNTVRFFNPKDYAPDLDRIVVR